MDDLRLGNLAERISEAFRMFSDEAQATRMLIEKLPVPATAQEYEDLLTQRLNETHALENYLQLSDQLFVYLRVREKPQTSKPRAQGFAHEPHSRS